MKSCEAPLRKQSVFDPGAVAPIQPSFFFVDAVLALKATARQVNPNSCLANKVSVNSTATTSAHAIKTYADCSEVLHPDGRSKSR